MNITDLQNFGYALSVIDEISQTKHSFAVKYNDLFFTADFFLKKEIPDYNGYRDTLLETSSNYTFLSEDLPNFRLENPTNQIAAIRRRVFDTMPKDDFGMHYKAPEELLLIPFITEIISNVDKTLTPQNTLHTAQNFKTLDGSLELPYYHFPIEAEFEVVNILKIED